MKRLRHPLGRGSAERKACTYTGQYHRDLQLTVTALGIYTRKYIFETVSEF